MLRYFNFLKTTVPAKDNVYKNMTMEQFRQYVQMDTVLRCPVGSEYFRLFCLKEHNEENLLCLMELFALETTTSEQEISAGMQDIYKRFMAVHAKEEINVSYDSLKTIRDKFDPEKADISLFEPIKSQLVANLTDPLTRFRHSAYFLEMYDVVKHLDIFRAKLLNSGKKRKGLNEDFPWNLSVRSGHTASSHLLEEMVNYLSTKSSALISQAGQIEYGEIEGCEWIKMTHQINELQKIDPKVMSANERKAFFINVYNLLMIHGAVLQKGVPCCNIKHRCFMRKTSYNIGGTHYSLDDIYNGILRDNKKDWLHGARFSKKDFRHELALPHDFRIHFALLTLDATSPMLKIASAEVMEEYLDECTTDYLNRHVTLKDSLLTVPKVFFTYKSDLGKNGMEEFITKFNTKLDESQKRMLLSREYKIEFDQTPRITSFASVLCAEAPLSENIDVSDATRKEIEKTVAKKQQTKAKAEEQVGTAQ